jgi:hypothetical protein
MAGHGTGTRLFRIAVLDVTVAYPKSVFSARIVGFVNSSSDRYVKPSRFWRFAAFCIGYVNNFMAQGKPEYGSRPDHDETRSVQREPY